MTSTIKPALPPKPLHLSSAFTGTLDSNAFKSYIRQQSINTIAEKQQRQRNEDSFNHDPTPGNNRIRLSTREDDDEEDAEGGHTVCGTARQRQFIPTKPRYGDLVNLFDREDSLRGASQTTIKSNQAAKTLKGESEESVSNCDVGTIKVSNMTKEPRSSSPVVGHIRGRTDQSSYSSSSVGTERSRQPSILSRLSAFDDDDEDTNEDSFTSAQQETPKKKKWIHIRDGSAFERAGPIKTTSSPSKIHSGFSGDSIRERMEIIAGPPPLRPSSICVDLTGEDERQQHASQSVKSTSSSRVKAARALYSFSGEVTFNELSLFSGQSFEILSEDVGGGWSLAIVREQGSEKRGLVPRGWYTYVHDFANLPILPIRGEAHSSIKSEPPLMQLDHSIDDTTESFCSFLGPSSSSIFYNQTEHLGSGTLNLKDTLQQHKIQSSRPASGIGQVYSEAGAAVQALTHLQPSTSASSHMNSKTNNTPLKTFTDVSSNSLESEGVCVPTSISARTQEAEAVQFSPKPKSVLSSPWKAASLFGGRGFNRYVPFVTSGAEEYILFGETCKGKAEGLDDSFDVVSGHHGYPSWKHPGLNIAAGIHSPEIHTDESGKDYVAYAIYSSYVLSSEEQLDWASSINQDPHVRPQEAALTSSVFRRFNQFRWLSSYLGKLFPVLMLSMPPFPNQGYKARFDSLLVEQRRRHLQTWLLQIVRHPVLSNEVAVRFFLDSEEEGKEWSISAKKVQKLEADLRDASTLLFSKTVHPLFDVDVCESDIEAGQVAAFCHAYQKSLTTDAGILATFKALRQNCMSTSDSYRHFSYSLLRLITGSAQVNSKSNTTSVKTVFQLDNQVTLPPMGNVGRRDDSGATNEERAWCWREGCKECKRMTRSLQGTAEALQSLADSFESHSNGELFELHDRLVTMAKLNTQHRSLLDVHKATLLKYRQATGEGDPTSIVEDDDHSGHNISLPVGAAEEQMASRCESVVNVLMSEMDRIHIERCQDWNNFNNQFLDNQIELYEDVLSTLRKVRSRNQNQGEEGIIASGEGPILPSRYESHLFAPHPASSLLQPDLSGTNSSYFSIWN